MRMRGLLNLLFMFGPMIYRQIQKRQRNQQRRQPQQPQRRQHLPEERPGEYIKHEEVKPEYLEPDDPNEKLSDEDIMLDEKDLRHFDKTSRPKLREEELLLDTEDAKTPKKESDMDLKDFFLD